MFRSILSCASVVCVALLGLGWAYGQNPASPESEAEMKQEREAVAAEQAKLNRALAALQQRQLELQKKNGYYARLNINGRLEVEKRKLEIESMDGTKHSGPFTVSALFIAAGEHRYELSFPQHDRDKMTEHLSKYVGRTVLVSGELGPPRPGQTPVLQVRVHEIDPKTEVTKIESAQLLKGLTLKATIKQAIGGFSSFGRPSVGDTLELDFENLPREKITLGTTKNGPSYIPLSTPLIVEDAELKKEESKSGKSVIELSSRNTTHNFRMRMIVDGELVKGSKVRLTFSMDNDDRYFASIAEAEGVLE